MTSDRPRHARSRRVLATLLMLALWSGGPSCTESTEGIHVELLVGSADSPPSLVRFADGTEATLTRARVGIVSVELVPCDEDATLVELLALPVARAHETGSATRIGVPVALDALDPLAQHSPGAFTPAPGRYCGLEGTLAVPDDDAVGQDGSFHVAASLSATVTGGGSYAVESTMSVPFSVSFDAPLALDAEHRHTELHLEVDLAAWAGALYPSSEPASVADALALCRAAAAALVVTSS